MPSIKKVITLKISGKKEHREYLKLPSAVDIKSKQIISFRVPKVTVHDTRKFVPMIKEIYKHHRIAKAYADKVYESKENFNFLDKMHSEPVISIRRNASGRTRNCNSRNELVNLTEIIGYDRYKKLKDA